MSGTGSAGRHGGSGQAPTHINVARWKKGGDRFEIPIDPNKALAWKKTGGDIRDAITVQKIFTDAQKGMLASEHRLQELFGTTDPLVIAEKILAEGEIPLTSEHKAQIREQLLRQIVQLIHKQGVDPRTHAPHPIDRIESAMHEAKVRIDDFRPADQQVKEVLRQLQPILAIALETKNIAITIPAEFASKCVGAVKSMGTVMRDAWLPDGSWSATVEIPGGLELEFYDRLNKITHGRTHATVLKSG